MKLTEITARVDKEIVRAKPHHVESTHFLIVPSHFLITLPLFLRQVASFFHTEENHITNSSTLKFQISNFFTSLGKKKKKRVNVGE